MCDDVMVDRIFEDRRPSFSVSVCFCLAQRIGATLQTQLCSSRGHSVEPLETVSASSSCSNVENEDWPG